MRLHYCLLYCIVFYISIIFCVSLLHSFELSFALEKENYVNYYNYYTGINMYYPQSWFKEEIENGVLFYSPDNDEYLNITLHHNVSTLEDYVWEILKSKENDNYFYDNFNLINSSYYKNVSSIDESRYIIFKNISTYAISYNFTLFDIPWEGKDIFVPYSNNTLLSNHS